MEAESFLDKIKPPRLEDAGLEDCALPPESVKEAFLKAASAVRSMVSAFGDGDESGGGCVEDPWEESSDALVGTNVSATGPSEGCAVEKGGGLTEAPGDRVLVVGGDETAVDELVQGADARGAEAACVDVLQGLEIGDVDEEDGEKRGEDEPILVEGYGA